MLHQPSTRFMAAEPAGAEGLSRARPQASDAKQDRAGPMMDEAADDHPWSHPARVARPRTGATRLFIDCASL